MPVFLRPPQANLQHEQAREQILIEANSDASRQRFFNSVNQDES